MKRFKHLTVGGTFDRLHAGHLSLLNHAFEISEHVSVALASDDMTKEKLLAETVQPFSIRKKELEEYLTTKHVFERATIFELKDIYGISKSDQTLEAIIVTQETLSNALAINTYRTQHQLNPLEIIVLPFITGNDGQIISSTRVRKGEIDRNGYWFGTAFINKKKLILPQELRNKLREPIGKIVLSNGHTEKTVAQEVKDYIQKHTPPLVITIGDIITRSLIAVDYMPHIAIVDFKNKRKRLKKDISLTNQVYFYNRAGTINPKISGVLQAIIETQLTEKQKQVITVRGEEDLLALPAILLAPLDSIILYGQFDMGVVVVHVTEELKQRINTIVEQFKITAKN